jgi:plasmid replication initiation protein
MEKDYLVTKSNYFIMNSHYDLSFQEQKIILTLASMVQPEDTEFKEYKFKIKDFIELLGLKTQTKYSEVPKITKELMKKVFEIKEGKDIIQLAWLSSARYKTGEGIVILKFDSNLKPYMLQLNTVFTNYKLANILSMKSKYAPRIYEILKCNEFKKQEYIEIEIDELRKLLKIEKKYPLYNDIKRKIIEQSQKELEKLSDISFEFEEIKTGRKVTSLKFYINTNKTKNKALEEACVTEEVKYTNKEEKCHTELINRVKNIFKEKITDLEAKFILNTAKSDINIIKEKYDIVSKMKRVDSVVATMIDAIRKDYQAPKGNEKVGSFNNYEQRVYDFDELERKLLGWDNSKTDEVTGNEYQQLSIRDEK